MRKLHSAYKCADVADNEKADRRDLVTPYNVQFQSKYKRYFNLLYFPVPAAVASAVPSILVVVVTPPHGKSKAACGRATFTQKERPFFCLLLSLCSNTPCTCACLLDVMRLNQRCTSVSPGIFRRWWSTAADSDEAPKRPRPSTPHSRAEYVVALDVQGRRRLSRTAVRSERTAKFADMLSHAIFKRMYHYYKI